MPETKNERLALLLGWVRHTVRDFDGYDLEAREVWKTIDGWKLEPEDGSYRYSRECPDYDQWERFPELQAYVRGLEFIVRAEVQGACQLAMGVKPLLTGITPAILGDALLEVCDA